MTEDDPLSTRWRLDDVQLATAFKTAAIERGALCMLGKDLPDPKALAALKGTGLLHGKGVRGDAKAALQAVADPNLVLHVMRTFTGTNRFLESFVSRGPECYAVYGTAAAEFDLVYLPTAAETLLLLDRDLGFSTQPNLPTRFSVDLSAAGLCALFAAVDSRRDDDLRGQLRRKPVPPTALTADRAEDMLGEGMKGLETRWAVNGLQLMGPVRLETLQGRMGAGLDELVKVGWLKAHKHAYEPTDKGRRMIAALLNTIQVVSLRWVARDRTGVARSAYHTVFRTADAVWVAAWSDPFGAHPTVEWRRMPQQEALVFLSGLLEPELADLYADMQRGDAAPEPAGKGETRKDAPAADPAGHACSACHTTVPQGAKFCPGCGSKVCKACATALPPKAKFCGKCGEGQG